MIYNSMEHFDATLDSMRNAALNAALHAPLGVPDDQRFRQIEVLATGGSDGREILSKRV